MIFWNNLWRLSKINETAFTIACENCYIDIIKLLLSQEGININTENVLLFCLLFIFLFFLFQNIIWNLFYIFENALMLVSQKGNNEIMEILLKQNIIDINAENV